MQNIARVIAHSDQRDASVRVGDGGPEMQLGVPISTASSMSRREFELGVPT